ncbi:hypothetical protein BJ165DRAFT_1527769 [Panaeolus papilionaceus]|nr:hypothetical protein BJ165DRAFT_1527769 [Panaeolus papilionaceus]
MDHVLCKDRLPRVISLLACCSIGWLAYTRYIRKHNVFHHFRAKAVHCASAFVIPAQPNLGKLSLDVLLEVISYLDWNEVLVLRQVCTSLKLATHQRVVWYNLIRSSPDSRYFLKKKMQMCSSQELEEAFIKMHSANRGWATPGAPRLIEKISGLGPVSWHNYEILPGGRWLIKLEATYELLYTDLDSPERVWCSLIPSSLRYTSSTPGSPSWTPLRSILDHDLDADRLTFTIALIAPIEGPGDSPMKFDIWRCTSDFDEDGNEIGLQALKLSTFVDQDLDFDADKVCMRDDFVAYINIDDHRPVVIDWNLANGHLDNPPRLCFPDTYHDIEDLHLIPKSKQILCRAAYRWHIMSWNNLRPTRDRRFEASAVDICISEAAGPIPIFFSSGNGLLLHNNTASFLVYTSGAFSRVSFRIPDPIAPKPFTINVDSLYTGDPEMSHCYFTRNRVMLIVKDLEVVTGSYNMNDDRKERPLNLFARGKILPFRDLDDMIHDDISGRCLILPSLAQLECYLLDF